MLGLSWNPYELVDINKGAKNMGKTKVKLWDRRGGGASSTTTSGTTSSIASTSPSTSISISSSTSSASLSSSSVSQTPTSTLATTTTRGKCTTTSSTATVTYAGGPLLVKGINIYGIFYGNHSDDTVSKIGTFVSALGKSSRWAVDRQYKDSNGNHINDNVTWVGYYLDNTLSHGADISGKIDNIIDAAVKAKGWPKNDQNGIYPVFVGVGVQERMSLAGGKLCKDYCGYHDKNSQGRLFNVIGDAVACPGTLPPVGQCAGTPGCLQSPYRNQTETYSINNNQHADSMLNILLHEIGETASDYQAGYRDSKGNENADKCNHDYVQIFGSGSGVYNVDFSSSGGSKYLVQSQWSLDLQKCVISG
ncbi:hypothetical protein HDU76_000697 [Blyttiomyces sp. JEL0837]|nr:hypothetical protein HDU76_000697 [Blyttiomyces sp. JEL0837]